MRNGTKTKPGRKFRCEECGATAARNGNPFTAFTLKMHQGRMHGVKKLNGHSPCFNLTARQNQIMELICAGKTERGAAEELGLSYHTAHTHVRVIYQKLGLHSRLEAVKKWMENKSRTRRLSEPMPARSLQFCPSCGCHLAARVSPNAPTAAVGTYAG